MDDPVPHSREFTMEVCDQASSAFCGGSRCRYQRTDTKGNALEIGFLISGFDCILKLFFAFTLFEIQATYRSAFIWHNFRIKIVSFWFILNIVKDEKDEVEMCPMRRNSRCLWSDVTNITERSRGTVKRWNIFLNLPLDPDRFRVRPFLSLEISVSY